MAGTYELGPWSLSDLFPSADSVEVEKAIEDLDSQIQDFETYRDQLTDEISSDLLVEILDRYDEGIRKLSRVLGFAHLRFSEDTQDQSAIAFLGKIQQISAGLQNRTLFFSLWWKALDDEIVDRLIKKTGDYRYFLEELRLQTPYTLSEAEEKVINLKDVNGIQAIVNLYSSITNRYTFNISVDGEEKQLTRGELGVYYRSSDPSLREAAYKELYRVYEQDAPILGQIYQVRARDWRSEQIELRGKSSPMSVRNLGNNLPDDVVEALLESCRSNASIFHDFFRLKARWIGMDKLRRYDVYAPVAESEKEYSFSDAVEITLDSFQKFDPHFSELAQKVLNEGHLDSEIRVGKRSGAFCATLTPDLTPWVLTNFQGRANDVATLAHELGHAVHSLLADGHKALTQDASLPLAETASTFGEILLIDHFLELDPDPGVRRDLRFRQIDDAFATILRQAYFAIFERDAHEMVRNGATVDEISAAYLENLKEQFGDSLDLSDDFRFEWVAIPHIYNSPFYVYAYAFGQLLVFSLYREYGEEGDAFKPRYREILSAGGSDAPIRILERANVDVRSPDFWQGGFDVIADLLKQLEAIAIPN